MTKKRYESDLTKKEKRELEREKIKNMSWKERPGYFWEYYKGHMAGAIAIIVLIGMICQLVYRSQYESKLTVMLLNGGAGDSDAMTQDFREYIGDDEKFHEFSIDSSMFVGDNGPADYTTAVKLLALVGANDLDVLIAPRDQFKKYEDQEGTLLLMEEILTEEQMEAYREDIVDGALLYLGENARMQDYLMGVGEDSYLGIFAFPEDMEVTREFIRFMKEESHE